MNIAQPYTSDQQRDVSSFHFQFNAAYFDIFVFSTLKAEQHCKQVKHERELRLETSARKHRPSFVLFTMILLKIYFKSVCSSANINQPTSI